MATQGWQPQPLQPPVPGQPALTRPQSHLVPSCTALNQGQGLQRPTFSVSSSISASPSASVPSYRAPNQANSGSASPQPQQATTSPSSAGLFQASAYVTPPPSTGQSGPGFVPSPATYLGVRWQQPPPGLPAQSGQTATLGHSAPAGMIVSPVPPGMGGPSGPSGSPGIPSPGPPGLSGTPGAPGHTGQIGPPGYSGLSGSPGLSGSLVPPGFSGISAPLGISGPSAYPGVSGPAPPPPPPPPPPPMGPPGPPGVSGSTGPSGPSPPPGIPGPAGSGSNSSSAGARTPSEGPILGLRPGVISSGQTTTLSTSVAAGSNAPLLPQSPHQPYVAGPSLAPQQMSPWISQSQTGGQLQPRPFLPYSVSFLGSFGQSRPAGLLQTVISQSLSSSTILVPPGEHVPSQVLSVQPLNNWGGKMLPSSTTSCQVVDICGTSSGGSSSSVLSKPTGVASGENGTTSDVNLKMVESAKQEVVDTWTAHKTVEGTIYYFNSDSGQSTYDRPLGFQGEPDKVIFQPTPIAWERLSGSDWALVTTNDGKKYYYNTKNQATSWHIPPEIAEFRKKQMEENTAKLSTASVGEKSTVSFSLNIPAAVTGVREALGHKAIGPPIGSSALDLVKKKLQDSVIPVTATMVSNVSVPATINSVTAADSNIMKVVVVEGNRDRPKGNTAEGSSSESSSDSEDEDPGPSKEERILQFKEMLKEKGVAPFSKWEKELPKIIFDPRFKAIPSHTERRSIFEHYVRTRAEEERKEKRAAQKAAVEGFRQLLEEASKDINYKTEYESFARIWEHDRRFETLDRKDREMLLNERVAPLRKAEEERIRAVHAAAVGGFKAMLKEKGEINTSSRWSRVKDSMRNDPRYKMVKREDREALFSAYVGELRSAEQEAERVAKAKREEEEKIKEREREMRKRKEREEQEMERVRAKARRKDAVTAYQALLTEKIRDPEASWTEARPKLEKDSLGRASNPELDLADRERLFRDHVKELYERCIREYRILLADLITTDAATKYMEEGRNILTSWSEAKKLLKSDPRYGRMPRRDRESWWHRYAEDVQRRLKGTASNSKDDKQPDKAPPVDSNRRSPGARRMSSRR